MSLIDSKNNYQTDKNTDHNYLDKYDKYFNKFKDQKINLLEIGIFHGGSLEMWRDYFKNGTIFGLDIDKKKLDLGDRVKIYQGAQENINDLKKIINDAKSFDLIIDDGSHMNQHQIKSFEILFPYLNHGGYYVVEDIQSSYMLRYGGDGFYIYNNKNAINYFLNLVHKINYKEIENPFSNFSQDYYANNITDIHFYHNLIFIKKDKNLEDSNILVNFKRPIRGKSYRKLRSIIKYLKYSILYLRSLYYKLLDILKI